MSKFNHVWVQLEPEALVLRKSGFTPQQTCTMLARMAFDDIGKFNTVKGWYKRTFTDWPSEEDRATFKQHRQGQNGGTHQQQDGRYPQMPQYRQSYPRNEQSYTAQRGPISRYPHQVSWQGSHPQDAAIQYPFQQAVVQSPASPDFLYTASVAAHGMHHQSSSQNRSENAGWQTSPEQFHSSYRQDGKVLQPQPEASRANEQNQPHCRQQSILGSPQSDQRAQSARHESLSAHCGPFGGDICQESPSPQKNINNYSWLYGSDNLEGPAGSECFAGSCPVGGGINPTVDGKHSTMQSTVAPNQLILAPDTSQTIAPQPLTPQGVPQLSTQSFAVSGRNDQTYAPPDSQKLNGTFVGQRGLPHNPAKHYRSSSILPDPTPPPQCPLPPAPPMRFGVIHKGPNKASWHPIGIREKSMVTANPDRFRTDHPPKRVKGQLGSETRDSIALYQRQVEARHTMSPRSPVSYIANPAEAGSLSINEPVKRSNASIDSSLRDSGYISNFDSALVESVRSSLSNFNLTDNPEREYKDVDDGSVEVEIKIKGRVRKSYMASGFGPEQFLEALASYQQSLDG